MILVVLGTRPEAIKLLPIIKEFRKRNIKFELLNTNQHSEILDTVLDENGVKPKYKLNIHGRHTGLLDVKCEMLRQMNTILSPSRYTNVMVQGDTLSALVGAEYGFFYCIPVCHIEAGMRTHDIRNPYPEESFRRMIGSMSTVHFCPSETERDNLYKESITDNVYVVGNTFVDYRNNERPKNEEIKKQVLVTIHRRENLPYLDKIFSDIADLTKITEGYKWLFPVHPNPEIVKKAKQWLGGITGVELCEPLSPEQFYMELQGSEIIISDSGGVHEECLLNNKKILIVRDATERRTDFDNTELISPTANIKDSFINLLNREIKDDSSKCYGLGDTAEKIVDILIGEVK